MIQITLAPDGGLRLILPAGRALDVGYTLGSLHFIQRILRDAAKGKPALADQQRGYIGEFPTQAVIDAWKKADREAQVEQTKEEFKAKGIDVEMLEFRL